MSQVTRTRGMTVAEFRRRKHGEPLVCLTAYTTPMARLLDPVCDLLLVGDSLGMVVYGLPSTVPVTLEMMVAHGAAVVRGAGHSLVIVDMPFGSYQESPAQAFRTAARIMAETGCAGVKLEGGAVMAGTIAFLVERGVPVPGHVGLLPQSVHSYGGYGARGRVEAEAAQIVADARAVAEAGAFAMVVEGIVEPLALRVTEAVPVPTIGIGASAVATARSWSARMRSACSPISCRASSSTTPTWPVSSAKLPWPTRRTSAPAASRGLSISTARRRRSRRAGVSQLATAVRWPSCAPRSGSGAAWASPSASCRRWVLCTRATFPWSGKRWP